MRHFAPLKKGIETAYFNPVVTVSATETFIIPAHSAGGSAKRRRDLVQRQPAPAPAVTLAAVFNPNAASGLLGFAATVVSDTCS